MKFTTSTALDGHAGGGGAFKNKQIKWNTREKDCIENNGDKEISQGRRDTLALLVAEKLLWRTDGYVKEGRGYNHHVL